jgi:hypothetical protein
MISTQSKKEIEKLDFKANPYVISDTILLDARTNTNFIFQVVDFLPSSKDIKAINSISTPSRIKDIINEIRKENGRLKFINIENEIFNGNLILIDSLLPNMLAQIIETFFSTHLSSIKNLTKNLNKSNPLNYDLQFADIFYEHKIKHLLTDLILGMIPSKVWAGKYDAEFSHLIEKEKAAFLYNRNQFEDYLFANTKLETASSTRHDFGKVYEENGNFYFKLNLQIRFK